MATYDQLFGKEGEPPSRKVWAPRKAYFTQCSCVLLDAPVDLATIARTLGAFDVTGEHPAAPAPLGTAYSGPSLTVAYRPDVKGYATIDVVDQPWPDAMGEERGTDDGAFAAWLMGAFGPSSFPGNLERALQHAYRYPDAARVVARHRAFLRVRTTYARVQPSARLVPDDYDALDELRFVSDLVLAALDVPSALCAFNPNGEVLLDAEELRRVRDRERDEGVMAVEAWANIRMFRPGRLGEAGWLFYDTIGMEQLDHRDHEASLPNAPDGGAVPGFLWAIAAYDVEHGGVMGRGDTVPGPDEKLWRAKSKGESLFPAPRPVLRWFPDDVEPPAQLVPAAKEDE